MSANWAPCRNCPHLVEEHEAVIIKPIAVDRGARVLFEGTLGRCLADGCECVMWMQENPTRRELAKESREVPDSCELVAIPDADWRIEPGWSTCRRKGCDAPTAASLLRGTRRPQRWRYCEDHMYGRWIEDGQVWHWILREKTDA